MTGDFSNSPILERVTGGGHLNRFGSEWPFYGDVSHSLDMTGKTDCYPESRVPRDTPSDNEMSPQDIPCLRSARQCWGFLDINKFVTKSRNFVRKNVTKSTTVFIVYLHNIWERGAMICKHCGGLVVLVRT